MVAAARSTYRTGTADVPRVRRPASKPDSYFTKIA